MTETDGPFVRDLATSSDDNWDDSALIKAYDKAVNLAKEEVAKRMGIASATIEEKFDGKSRKERQMNKTKKWTVGSPCQAIYSEDGQLYEATVHKIYEDTQTCIVKFIGYGNVERVHLSSLLESNGLQSQIAQEKRALENKQDGLDSESVYSNSGEAKNGAAEEKMDCGGDYSKASGNTFAPHFRLVSDMIPPAPPIPPQLMASLPENDTEALSSMLMAWYISGFHTGYYHGLKQARENHKSRRK